MVTMVLTMVGAAAMEVAYGSASAPPGCESPRRLCLLLYLSIRLDILVRRRVYADIYYYEATITHPVGRWHLTL